MIVFKYQLRSYPQFLQEFADYLGLPVVDQTIHTQPPMGKGCFATITLSADINVLIYTVDLKEDLLLLRQKGKDQFYTLIYEQADHGDDFAMKIGTQSLLIEKGPRTIMYLTSFLYELGHLYPADSSIRGIRIQIPSEWMQNNLGLSGTDDVLKKYIEMKTSGILLNSISPESRKIFEEIFEPTPEDKNLLFYKIRILRIIELFSTWLMKSAEAIPVFRDINKADIENILRTEAFLVRDLTKSPPGIEDLARMAGMSASKFKTFFKRIYGLPPYSHFQKYRMQKAYQMLLSGDHSIKEIGYTLGYSNLSNFALAFKKQYQKLPSEVFVN